MLHKLFYVLSHLLLASRTFSKRRLPDFGEDPPEKKLRANLADLILENDISGTRAQSVFDDAHAAGLREFRELAKPPAGGGPRNKSNLVRNLRRKLFKRTHWPNPYYAKVRVWNKRTQMETTAWLPFMLPHELLSTMQSHKHYNNTQLKTEVVVGESFGCSRAPVQHVDLCCLDF